MPVCDSGERHEWSIIFQALPARWALGSRKLEPRRPFCARRISSWFSVLICTCFFVVQCVRAWKRPSRIVDQRLSFNGCIDPASDFYAIIRAHGGVFYSEKRVEKSNWNSPDGTQPLVKCAVEAPIMSSTRPPIGIYITSRHETRARFTLNDRSCARRVHQLTTTDIVEIRALAFH